MSNTFSNIDEWRQNKRWSDELAVHCEMADENDSKISMRGFIYPDGAWIELIEDGQWHTIVANCERASFDLREIELYLWQTHSSYSLA